MNKIKVVCAWDEDSNSYEVLTDGSRWNGFINVHASLDTFKDILETLPNDYRINQDGSIDVYTVDNDIDTYKPVNIDGDALYDIGGGSFCFFEKE